jgi:hypothetical protein
VVNAKEVTNGRLHPLDGEKGGEVGGVGGDHDEGEEPPEPRHHPSGECAEQDHPC